MRGIITLCGSTIFKSHFVKINRALTLSGWAVFGLEGTYSKCEPDVIAHQILAREKDICKLHKEKIEISQAIFVVDVGGYYGAHTKSEIKHAKKLGKQIYWFSKGDLKRITRPGV